MILKLSQGPEVIKLFQKVVHAAVGKPGFRGISTFLIFIRIHLKLASWIPMK